MVTSEATRSRVYVHLDGWISSGINDLTTHHARDCDDITRRSERFARRGSNDCR